MPSRIVLDRRELRASRCRSVHGSSDGRPGTVETFGLVVRLDILPEFGHRPVSAGRAVPCRGAARRDARQAVSGESGPDVLTKMFRLAEAWGMTPPRRNPALSIWRYKEYRRERFLAPDEYRRLARVLDEAEADGSVFPSAIPAIRLILLTGCRRTEILTLRWDAFDRTAGET